MIDTKLLRQKLLDLAIRGKLVPQDHSDEPASVLLQKIREEKSALVKAGKIKKDKHESFIFRGDDNRYYEQIDGKVTNISEEIPFKLPDSWVWCRLQDVYCECNVGIVIRPTRYYTTANKGIPAFRNANIKPNRVDGSSWIYLTHEGIQENPRCVVHENDLLISRSGNAGTCCVADGKYDGYGTVDVLLISLDSKCSPFFVSYCINSPFCQDKISQSNRGVALSHIGVNSISRILFPLPPLTEQKRIVTQLESLLKCVDEIDRESETLEKTITLAKQKILDLAIRGKLIPQNPTDEPASELPKKIKAEKEALIKAGKLKRDKHESFIFRGDDNCYYEDDGKTQTNITAQIPFDLPPSWAWCRIKNIGMLNPRNSASDDTLVSFMPMAQLEAGYGSHYILEERQWKEVKQGFTHFAENDVVVAKITPCFQNRKSAVMHGLKNGLGAGTTELHVFRGNSSYIFPEYVLLFFKNQQFITDAVSTIQGVVGQQRIDVNFIKEHLFPLPPLAEQKRIVSQIEQVFAQLETMQD